MSVSESEDVGVLANNLASALAVFLVDGSNGESKEDVLDVARYLADEYRQLGSEAILLTSQETGRVIARLTEKDLYQPMPVTRETGQVVVRPRAIRPEVEALIVQYEFDSAFEKKNKSEFLEKMKEKGITLASDDPRLLMLSRIGRRQILSQLQEALPQVLKEYCRGSIKKVLDYFTVVEEPIEEPRYLSFKVEPKTTSTSPLQDLTSNNVHYDLWSSLLFTTATGWVREIVGSMAMALEKSSLVPEIAYPLPRLAEELGQGMWLCSPNAYHHLRSLNSDAVIVPVPQIQSDDLAISLREHVGYLYVDPASYKASEREALSRWTLSSKFHGQVWVKSDKVTFVRLFGVPKTGASVEGGK